jgi:PAS domain S-box-containing protein
MKNKPTYGELLIKIRQLEQENTLLNSNSINRLFELSIDMLCIADFDGYFKVINPAFEKTLGYSIKELTEHPYLYFVHPDDQEFTKSAMRQLSNGNSVTDFENRYRCRNGSYKWLRWSSMPIPSENLT